MGKRVGQRRFPAGQGGFTLLEVIVAVALLAVLAVLSLRGIDSVLRSRERLSAAAAELDALTVCFTQIEEDLRRAWPVRLRLASESPIQFSPAAPEEGAPPLLAQVQHLARGLHVHVFEHAPLAQRALLFGCRAAHGGALLGGDAGGGGVGRV